MGPYAGVDYITLPLQSRLQHIYHGKPYARVDFIPQSGTLDLASGLKTPHFGGGCVGPGLYSSSSLVLNLFTHIPVCPG
jgi:hypothetical protein